MATEAEPESLDPAALAGLRALAGPDEPNFFPELVGQFVKHGDGAIPALRQALAAGDAKRVEDLAHSLKGSSGNMGAMRLHRLCGRLQKAGATKDLGSAAPSLGAVAAEYAVVRERLIAEAAREIAAPRPDSAVE